RFEIGKPFDIADRPTDLAEYEIKALIAFADEVLNGVGNMRDDLDRCTKVIAAPLARENVLVDTTGGNVVVTRSRTASEALVVTEIEVGFSAVVGDEDFAVLVGRHRAWIDVEVGIELAQANFVAARLQQRAKRRRSETLAE